MTESERCSEGRVAFRSLVIIVSACFAMLVGPAFGAGGARAGVVPTALPGAPAFPDALRSSLEEALQSRAKGFAARTRHLRPDGTPEYTNRLVLEKSPYLQQHAHNPVNWYPWGEQAFAAARRLGRPVLVSIGYSTCHWCHVMEEESFDSVETARELNSHFIAIKVDREARPDVDAIYMSAIHAMGQRGGWPLNLWLTPDGEPFFGGTYFPKQDRGGRRGFVSVLESIHRAYSDDRERIQSGASQLAARIKKQLEGHVAVASVRFGGPILERVLAHYDRAADREWGGVGSGTKFPSSLPIGLLLREARRTQNPKTLDPALLTLDKMARGGIHDHL
ncbi:MAG: thioredoxin domain-containing protein, partial [Deltaproteobacteria bacterium]|nr:thioredoxin domain-containing protein [Deltaproteobacteria bacterium]